jgi:hypothetical protein
LQARGSPTNGLLLAACSEESQPQNQMDIPSKRNLYMRPETSSQGRGKQPEFFD